MSDTFFNLGSVDRPDAPSLLDEVSVRVLSCRAGLAVVDRYVAELGPYSIEYFLA